MAALKKLISLHPRFSAIADVAVAGILLWWFQSIETMWVFLVWCIVRPVWWVFLVQATYYPGILSRIRHFFTLVLFFVGSVILLLFIYTPWIRTVLMSVLMLVPAVSFWLIPKEEVSLSFALKPLRRWLWLMSVTGLMGLWTGVYGSELFQLISLGNVFGLIVLVTLLTMLVSAWWWQEYEVNKVGFFQALGIIGILVFEISLSLVIWPAGYLINAFLVTWIWYVLWLLLRFSLTADGIRWEKQGRFLVVNTVLFLVYCLFIVRWK